MNGTTLCITGDENCLYNSISLSLYGKESMSNMIRLSMIFILFEYEDFFRKIGVSFSLRESFEKFKFSYSPFRGLMSV